MSAPTDVPKASFRLNQLIYDKRYRSITIQVIALVLLVAALWWLVNNTVQNLETLGKDFDFGFLTQPAGYDINQRLIDYDSQSTHSRAAMVGILNTLLVALLGCALATIVGVLAGVLRLSKNWLVSNLTAVYVEGFRNVPLLLWIILIFAIMTESTPEPRDFRGEDATASLIVGETVAVTNRGVYIPRVGFENSLSAAGADWRAETAALEAGEEAAPPPSSGLDWLIVFGVLGASILGARWNTRRADAIQEATGDRPATWYVNLGIIVVPTLAALLALGATIVAPVFRGFNFAEGIHLRNSLIALWLALAFYTGAFVAEIVRAGILSVSKGQTEAASALGLRPGRIMNLVILPQALRVIIPPLISQYLNLTKNSSLAIAVGYMDVRSTLGGITINQTGRELEGMLLLGLFYLVLSLVISALMNVYNNAVKLKER